MFYPYAIFVQNCFDSIALRVLERCCTVTKFVGPTQVKLERNRLLIRFTVDIVDTAKFLQCGREWQGLSTLHEL